MKTRFVFLILALLFTAPVATRQAAEGPAEPAAAAGTGGEIDPAKIEQDLEEFVPTERISADRAISFPVDI